METVRVNKIKERCLLKWGTKDTFKHLRGIHLGKSEPDVCLTQMLQQCHETSPWRTQNQQAIAKQASA